MLTDLLLAIGHHLLIFALAALLVMEIMIVRPDMDRAAVLRAGRLDVAYGAVAGLILIVGFSRVFFGAKPADFYLWNWVFWAKVGAFVVIGLLSAVPTRRLLQWRKAAEADAAYAPPAGEIVTVRRLMHYEAVVFVLLPIFAAMMARGYGL